MYSKKEKHHWFSENPDEYSLGSRPRLVILLSEEDRLREVSPIEVAEVLVVMIVAVPPHLEGEVDIDADDVPEYFIE